jgi:hypothetical protein
VHQEVEEILEMISWKLTKEKNIHENQLNIYGANPWRQHPGQILIIIKRDTLGEKKNIYKSSETQR